jgi:hypothetical protein
MNARKKWIVIFSVAGLLLAWRIIPNLLPQRRGISAEAAAVMHIANAMGEYMYRKGNGHPPSTWAQIEEFIDLDNLNFYLKDCDCAPIQANYVIITNALPVLRRSSQANIVFIQLIPARNKGGHKGRFFIWWKGASVNSSWIPEGELQEILKSSGVTLPGIDEQEAARAKKLLEDTRIRLGR